MLQAVLEAHPCADVLLSWFLEDHPLGYLQSFSGWHFINELKEKFYSYKVDYTKHNIFSIFSSLVPLVLSFPSWLLRTKMNSSFYVCRGSQYLSKLMHPSKNALGLLDKRVVGW